MSAPQIIPLPTPYIQGVAIQNFILTVAQPEFRIFSIVGPDALISACNHIASVVNQLVIPSNIVTDSAKVTYLNTTLANLIATDGVISTFFANEGISSTLLPCIISSFVNYFYYRLLAVSDYNSSNLI